jgi:acyl-CoA thioester hydrolase
LDFFTRMEYNFESSTKIRVRYGETDQMGVAYYGNYAQFLEVGRVEALREIGMTYRSMEEKGVMLPVSEFYVKYIASAKYDDEITVVTAITSVEGARIRFDYQLFNEYKKCLAKAHTVLVFVNKESMRPTAAPKDFLSILEKYQIGP